MSFNKNDFYDFDYSLNGKSFYFAKAKKSSFIKDGSELEKKELGFPINMPLFFTEEFDFIEEDSQLRIQITKEGS